MKLVDIMVKQEVSIQNKNLKKIISNYIVILKSKKEVTSFELFKNVNIFTNQERENIYLFFNGLGRLDVVNQINELNNYINIFEEYYLKVKCDSEKYSTLCKKMGVLVGLFIAIIFA